MTKRMFLAQGGRISTRGLLIIAGVLAVIFVGGLVITSVFFKPHTPERVAADTFVNAMIKQDTSTYSMLSKRMQKENSKDNWSTIVSISFTNLKSKPKFISETPVTNPVPTYGKTANPQKLIYSFTDKTRGSYKMYVIMVYENNAWKVDEFNTAS